MATTLEIKLTADIAELQQALAQAHADLDKLRVGAKGAGDAGKKGFDDMTVSAGQTKQAFRQLPAQITDVVTQLAGGQNPLLILIQQGGQVKDSFGGIRPAIAAIAPLFTPARIAAGLLLGTATLLAAAFAKGQAEATALTSSLALTGNSAGRTTEELQNMAAAIDAISGTQSGATEALAQLIATGRVSGAELQKLALAAVELERVGGQSVADTVKQFSELGNDPVKSAVKLNETLNFLTPTIYAQIKALQESGQEARAAAVAQEAYASSITSRVAQIEGSLGSLQRAWNGVRSAAKEAWDTMLSVGRAATLQQQIAKQQAQVEGYEEQYRAAAAGIEGAGNTSTAEKALSDARARLGALQDQSKEETTLARKVGETAEQNKSVIAAMQVRERLGKAALSDQQKLNKTLEEYRQAVGDIRRGGGTVSPAEQAKEEASIRAQFAKKGSKPRKESGAAEGAEFALARAQLEAEQKLLESSLKESLAAYEQAYKDGLIGLDGYYTARESIEHKRLSKITELRKSELAAAQTREGEATRRKDEPARIRAQGEVVKLQAEVELAQGATDRLAAQIEAAKANDARLLASLKLKVDIELSQLQGIALDRATLEADLRGQMRDLFAKFADDPVMKAKLEKIVEIKANTTDFNQQFKDIEIKQRGAAQPLDAQAAAVQSQRQRGQISGPNAQRQTEGINQAKVAQLQAYQEQLIQLRSGLDQGEQSAEKLGQKLDLSEKINSLSTNIANLKPAVFDLGVAFEDSLAANSTQAFDDIINGTKSASQAFSDMAKAIIADIARMIVKMLVMKAIKALGFADGGAVGPARRLASGGAVHGPGGPRDDVIPAWLSNGEHVIDAKTVNQFGGHAFFNALRNIGQTGGSERATDRISGTLANLGFAISNMASPPVARGMRFADGGAVPSVSAARSQATTLVQNFNISGSADQRTQAQMGAAAFSGANRAFRRNN